MSFTSVSVTQAQQVVAGLIDRANREGGTLEFRDAHTGAVVATLITHRLPARPQDMPRALRPKMKLSKRARDAAKREKREKRDASLPAP